jgi:peptidoglycan hydrolase CwlO-like protein
VQKGSLDKEITELKGLISKLSSQISDLQREFDRSHQGEI